MVKQDVVYLVRIMVIKRNSLLIQSTVDVSQNNLAEWKKQDYPQNRFNKAEYPVLCPHQPKGFRNDFYQLYQWYKTLRRCQDSCHLILPLDTSLFSRVHLGSHSYICHFLGNWHFFRHQQPSPATANTTRQSKRCVSELRSGDTQALGNFRHSMAQSLNCNFDASSWKWEKLVHLKKTHKKYKIIAWT